MRYSGQRQIHCVTGITSLTPLGSRHLATVMTTIASLNERSVHFSELCGLPLCCGAC